MSKETEDYEEGELLRLEDVCLISGNKMAVADHANGILIFQLGDKGGSRLIKHLNSDKDTLAYVVRYDKTTNALYALILDVPGWILNVYDVKNDFAILKQIQTPSVPHVDRMKLRWLTVTAHGRVHLLVAGNVWSLDTANWTWTLVHSEQDKKVWYTHLNPMGNDQLDRYVVCRRGSTLRKVKLNENDGFIVENTDMPINGIKEMGAFTVDENGNLLISDWNTGEIILWNDNDKLIRKLGSVGENEAYVMTAEDHKVYVGCKSSLQVRVFSY